MSWGCQRGNILFLILLAIILFAALSYAVTQSTSGGAKNASGEKASAQAAELQNQAALLEQTVTRLRLSNGCGDTQISFENGTVSGYTNNNAPSDKKCHMFDPAGGALAWPALNANALDPAFSGQSQYGHWFFTGSTCMDGIGTGTVSSACWGSTTTSDLFAVAPFVTEAVCNELNFKAFGDRVMRQEWNSMYNNAKFQGAYSSSGVIDYNGSNNRIVYSLCLKGAAGSGGFTPDNSYHFIHVLIAR